MTRWCWLWLGCLLPALALAEEKLGRLFFTPAERAHLDSLRQTSQPPGKIVKPGNAEDALADKETVGLPAIPAAVTVQGYVRRSDGKGTVWINRQPIPEKSSHGELEVGKLSRDPGRVQVKLPSTGRTVELKAGQSYDPASGKVEDNLRDLSVEAVPAKETPSLVAPSSAR